MYGAIPQSVIDIEKETVKTLIQSKTELISAEKVQNNAYKQYVKSRPLPSAKILKSIKKQATVGLKIDIHPLLSKKVIYYSF